jgi:hypothetical protein
MLCTALQSTAFLHCVLHRGVRVFQDNVVGIVIRYWLDDPRIESRSGRYFSHPSSPALVRTQSPIQRVLNQYRRVKRPGHVVQHPPPSSAKDKEVRSYTIIPPMACSRAELLFYSYLYRRVRISLYFVVHCGVQPIQSCFVPMICVWMFWITWSLEFWCSFFMGFFCPRKFVESKTIICLV